MNICQCQYDDPHDWEGDGYWCERCGSSYHCPFCRRPVGMMGTHRGKPCPDSYEGQKEAKRQ